jgi:hypothetical protein
MLVSIVYGISGCIFASSHAKYDYDDGKDSEKYN